MSEPDTEDRESLVELVSQVLARNNDWAEEGTGFSDPNEWRVEAGHVVDALAPRLQRAPGDAEYSDLIQATGDMLATMQGMHDSMKRITSTHRIFLARMREISAEAPDA